MTFARGILSPRSPKLVGMIRSSIHLGTACIASAFLASIVTFTLCRHNPTLPLLPLPQQPPTLQELSSALDPNFHPADVSTVGSCWPASGPSLVAGGPQGLRVHGAGCSTCRVGDLCSFTISVASPATWNVSGTRPFEWDLMVSLRGPALVHAHVELSRTPASLAPGESGTGLVESNQQTFIATYRAWDAGTYRVSVANPCFTLVVPGNTPPPYANTAHIAEVASWSLTVQGAPATSAGSEQGLTLAKELPLLVPQPKEAVHVDACTETLKARWVRTASGEYDWQTYPCAGGGDVQAWFSKLAERGVTEIAFVGDSHLRLLLLHTVFLLTGRAHPQLLKAHKGFSILVPAPLPKGARNLTTNSRRSTAIMFSFLWVDGVFQNGEFGCAGRGLFSNNTDTFPNITSSPDIVVMDSGAWTAFKCQQPALAYASHLNSFVNFVRNQVAGQNDTQIVFFGGLPNPTCRAASAAATSSLTAFQADFARVVAAHHGIRFFNTWEVVAPQFHMPCIGAFNSYDVHFSCWETRVIDRRRRSIKMKGTVGEALVRAVFQFLAGL